MRYYLQTWGIPRFTGNSENCKKNYRGTLNPHKIKVLYVHVQTLQIPQIPPHHQGISIVRGSDGGRVAQRYDKSIAADQICQYYH